MNCIICGKTPKKADVDLVELGKNLGKFPCLQCECGERYYDEKTIVRIQAGQKRAGIFGFQQ